MTKRFVCDVLYKASRWRQLVQEVIELAKTNMA